MFKNISITLFFIFIFTSCANRKEFVYLQDIDSVSLKNNHYESVLQPDDLLSITVIGDNPEAVAPFNSPSSSSVSTQTKGSTAVTPYSYLIDNENTINFLSLGKIKLGGLTRAAAENLLISKLSLYVKNPKVDLRILNFKVTVQGEVVAPGTFSVASERITLLEALSLAGDLTIYGKRTNILVLRENVDEKTVQRIDLTKADFINSPYYYLHQNDVVYVEPNKPRLSSGKVGPNTGIIFSGISLLITIIALTVK